MSKTPPPSKAAPRSAANDAFKEVQDVNEKIMGDVYAAYVHDEADLNPDPFHGQPARIDPANLKPKREGIMQVCSKIGLPCIAPRRKINVMIVGNHSAGKSSYINWYVGEHVQSASVAIETQGFTFITSGKKRETLKGHATMQLYSHLHEDLRVFAPAIYNGLQTEVSTSKEKCFNLITFIDTPGLVDGSFQYPFPVEDAIIAVAKHTDLIYIFFDPIGQALCDRTMNVIKRLNQEHAGKLRYFLSKADTVPNERDRQKVVVQITQNLASHISNAHAFELPSLYIPSFAVEGSKASKIDNIIETTSQHMEQTISQNLQNNLNKLEHDCRRVGQKIEELMATDATSRAANRQAWLYGHALGMLSLSLLAGALALSLQRWQIESYMQLHPLAPALFLSIQQFSELLVGSAPAAAAADPQDPQLLPTAAAEGMLTLQELWMYTMLAFAVLQLASYLIRRYTPTFSKAGLRNLRETRTHVMETLLTQKHVLYKQYLEQCSSGVS